MVLSTATIMAKSHPMTNAPSQQFPGDDSHQPGWIGARTMGFQPKLAPTASALPLGRIARFCGDFIAGRTCVLHRNERAGPLCGPAVQDPGVPHKNVHPTVGTEAEVDGSAQSFAKGAVVFRLVGIEHADPALREVGEEELVAVRFGP